MAAIITNGNIKLFISFAPGTGSTSLEQHLRTISHLFLKAGLSISFFPKEEFGENGEVSRHINYSTYKLLTGSKCEFNATAVRNPFSYYFAEYHRIKTKWTKLLSDSNSWIYKEESKSTLDLILAAQESHSFDDWFSYVLKSTKNNYLMINEDHLATATHVFKSELLDSEFNQLIDNVFNVSNILEIIGNFPHVNVSVYKGSYHDEISFATKKWL